MAGPLPDPTSPPRHGAMARGVVLGLAGLGVLGAGLWLGLRDPAPSPTPGSATGPAARPPAVVPQATAPQATAPRPATAGTAPPTPSSPASPVAAPPVAVPAAPNPIAVAPAAPPGATPSVVASPAVAPPPVTQSLVAPLPPVAPDAPRFDIVRVSPSGGMVVAGRAAPDAQVILRANGREVGRARADAQGQWAIAGGTPLPPGAHEITVVALDAAGREIAGAGTVDAVVAAPALPAAAAAAPSQTQAPGAAQPPAAPAAPAAPIVVLNTPQGGPALLQAPGRAAGAAKLGLDIVDYDAGGEIRFAGTAPPGATVRVYVDNSHVGDAVSAEDGRWSLAPVAPVPQGEHRLRLDQVDRAGRVAGRVEQPFQRAAVAAMEGGAQRVVVQPTQSLWRIARHAYGRGVRYTEIYAANRDVIADPARIYPGQVFVVPAAAAMSQGPSTPTSASRSR